MKEAIDSPRRGFSITGARFITILLAGPLVGAMVYVLVGLAVEPAFRADEDALGLVLMMLVLGWPVGLPAAAVAATVWALIPHPRAFGPRVSLAIAVGALATPVGFVAAISVLGNIDFPDGRAALLVILSGAVALAVTALPKSSRPG